MQVSEIEHNRSFTLFEQQQQEQVEYKHNNLGIVNNFLYIIIL